MGILKVIKKIKHRWTKLIYQPIRILAFHHVANCYNALTMWQCDYTPTNLFTKNIETFINAGYQFITLEQAHQHLKKDLFRTKKYAVLTADDGYKTLFNILPWLFEKNIPVTLFINSAYLDGEKWSTNNEKQATKIDAAVDMKTLCKELYLSSLDLHDLSRQSHDLLTIGLHGHEHLLCTELSIAELNDNTTKCIQKLSQFENYIPYFAYPCDNYNDETHNTIIELGLTPVSISGRMNYHNSIVIERECIDGCNICTTDIIGPVKYPPTV